MFRSLLRFMRDSGGLTHGFRQLRRLTPRQARRFSALGGVLCLLCVGLAVFPVNAQVNAQVSAQVNAQGDRTLLAQAESPASPGATPSAAPPDVALPDATAPTWRNGITGRSRCCLTDR